MGDNIIRESEPSRARMFYFDFVILAHVESHPHADGSEF